MRSVSLSPAAVFLSVLFGGAMAVGAAEVDSLAIAKDFQSLPREVVIVADVPQPPQPSGKLKVAQNLGKLMTEELIRQLRAAMPAATVMAQGDAHQEVAGFVVECRFSKLAPGSQAKRFWLGFGAGKSVLEVTGEVHEKPSGRQVAHLVHARSSWCCGFGSNDTEIRNNLTEVATDISDVVAGRFDANQKYEWLTETAGQPQVIASATAGVRAPPLGEEGGKVLIDSSPAHCEVEVDGKPLGSTPLELELPDGDHTVVVRKTGFVDWTRKVTIVRGAKQTVWAELATERQQ